MNLGQIKDLALKLTDDYSQNGVVTPEGENADLINKMADFANDALSQLAKYDRIPAEHHISHYPPTNLLGTYEPFEVTKFTDADIKFSATGARSYYFQVDSDCTVYIEEETSEDTWETLDTLNIAGISKFTAYKGLITPSSTDNKVRLRFTGTYPFNIRYVALYETTYASADDVPSYEPYVSHDLPSDLWKVNKVVLQTDLQPFENFNDYKIKNKKFIFNRFYEGNIVIHYWKRPTKLSEDTDEPEISPENHYLIAQYVAAMVLISQREFNAGGLLLNKFEAGKEEIIGIADEDFKTIDDVMGW